MAKSIKERLLERLPGTRSSSDDGRSGGPPVGIGQKVAGFIQEFKTEMKKGKKKTGTRSFFPGYLLVQMELDEGTWHLVRHTPKVTGFVGGQHPAPIPESEVEDIKSQMVEGRLKPKPKITFSEGESVRVVDGPFSNFSGTVDSIKPDKGKVVVLVSIFGRATPVELDFTQVEKA